MAIEKGADDAAIEHARKSFVLLARCPLGHNFVTIRKTSNVKSRWICGPATEACSIGLISLAAVTTFGPLAGNQLSTVWLVYLIYSIGAFWIAWQQKLVEFNWIGAGLVLVTIASEFAWTAKFSFPWQSALLVHATLFAAGAIVCSRRANLTGLASTSRVLNLASLITLGLGVVSFFQTNPWQVT